MRRILALGLVALLVMACERLPEPSRDWTPQDHDNAEANAKASGQAPRAPRGSASAAEDDASLAELAWRQQCARCHGATGKGDGPEGPMVQAKDLTAEAWQSKVTDAEIAASIRGGKGKMPKFDQLSDRLVNGLVARVRAVRGR